MRLFLSLVFMSLFFFASLVQAREGGTIPCTDRDTTTCTSLDEALAVAKANATKAAVNYGNTDAGGYSAWVARYASHDHANPGTSGEFLSVVYEDVAPNGYVGFGGREFFYWKPKDCSNKPDLGQSVYSGANADFQICLDGCRYDGGFCVQTSLDGGFTTACTSWHSSGQTCSFAPPTTPPPDSDGDGSSDGNDSSPNNPGSGNPNQPQDGGGKGNGNGSGEGSGNGNTSGGGGSCSSPPASTGDAILAQIAYQTWATRCAIEGAKDGNGNLKTSNGSASGGGEGEGEGTNFGSSAPPADEPFDASEHQRFGIGLNSSMLDSEAIFGAGNCPVFTITIYQSTFSTSELPAWCDLLRVMRALVLLFGAFTALRILMGNNS